METLAYFDVMKMKSFISLAPGVALVNLNRLAFRTTISQKLLSSDSAIDVTSLVSSLTSLISSLASLISSFMLGLFSATGLGGGTFGGGMVVRYTGFLSSLGNQ